MCCSFMLKTTRPMPLLVFSYTIRVSKVESVDNLEK